MELSVSHSQFPLAIYFADGNVLENRYREAKQFAPGTTASKTWSGHRLWPSDSGACPFNPVIITEWSKICFTTNQFT